MKLTSILSCTTKLAVTQRRGFTLIEFAIVAGIIGLIMGSIWVFAGQTWENSRQRQLKSEIFTVVKNLRTYYQGQNGIPTASGFTLLTPRLITANIIPSDIIRTGGACNPGPSCADSPWSGDATTPATGSFGVCAWVVGQTGCPNGAVGGVAPYQYFALEIRAIPQAACAKAVANNTGTDGPPGLYDVVINTNSMLALGVIPPLPSRVMANCNSVLSNTIDFVYRVVMPQF